MNLNNLEKLLLASIWLILKFNIVFTNSDRLVFHHHNKLPPPKSPPQLDPITKTTTLLNRILKKRELIMTEPTTTTPTTTTKAKIITTTKVEYKYLEHILNDNYDQNDEDYGEIDTEAGDNDNDDNDDEAEEEEETTGDEDNVNRGECKLKTVEVQLNLAKCGRVTFNTNMCSGLCKSNEKVLANTKLKKRTCWACKPQKYIYKTYKIKCVDNSISYLKLKTISECSCFKQSEKILPLGG